MDLNEKCPRCGGSVQILKSIDWDNFVIDYYPQCSKCGLTTLRMFSNPDEASSAWSDLHEEVIECDGRCLNCEYYGTTDCPDNR